MKQLVIIPGGFHPFHAGHAALYQSAQAAFPAADVYVAATNDTSTRPFPFAIKEKLAKLAGVEAGHFIQVKSPFRAEEIVNQFNPNDTQLIFVRSEKDANKPPQGGGTKKDGSPSYLQPLGDDTQPLSQHAYMAYLPTVEFGPGMTSATEIRTAWPTLNEKRKTALVMSLYPKTQTNPKLAVNVVKMLDTAMGVVDESVLGNLPRPNNRNQFKSLHRLRKQRGLDEQGVAEGWKEKLGAATVAGAMALGAGGASADTRRVTPDGQGGFTGGWKPTSTQQSTDTAPTQSPASTTQHLSLPIPAAQAQYDNATKLLTYKGKQYKWDLDAQSTGQGEVVSAPSLAVGSRSMGPTNVELNPNGTYNRAPVNEATHHLKRGVAEGSLNEFAQGNGGDDGDDGEAFNPDLAKMAQEHGFTKGVSLADGSSLATAFKITKWDQAFGGLYKQYFVQGFKEGRMDKINHDNKQYNLNLKLMKDGSIRHGEQGVAEGSEWETRHDEFVTVGDRATPEQINKIVSALGVAAKQASSKRGFLNQIVGKQSNSDLARMAHGAETLAKNIQRNSKAKPGTDERKELGQQLVYAVSLLKRMNGEQGVAAAPDYMEENIKRQ